MGAGRPPRKGVDVGVGRRGVDVGARDAEGMTAMYIAAAYGHTAVVELLADEGGADVSEGTLADAKMLLVESWKTENPP